MSMKYYTAMPCRALYFVVYHSAFAVEMHTLTVLTKLIRLGVMQLTNQISMEGTLWHGQDLIKLSL